MQYVCTGLGTPPHCEISLKADSDETTPPDLILNIILRGVKDECNKLIISRAAEPMGQLQSVVGDPDAAKLKSFLLTFVAYLQYLMIQNRLWPH